MKTLRRRRLEGLTVLAIFSLALLPRIPSLDVFLTPDELTWAMRSIRFRAALSDGDLAGTLQSEHPGVVTTWIGVATMPSDGVADWVLSRDDTTMTRMAMAAGPERLARLAEFAFMARLPIALVASAFVVAIYLLTKKLFGGQVALLSAILIALDPFFIAHSRLFHLDALVTGFMTLSVLGLLVSLTGRGSYAYLAFSGSMAGLAFLTKSPAFFLAPFAFALTVVMGLCSRQEKRSQLMLPFLVWATAAGAVYFALWPAMWVDPVGTIGAVLDEAFKYASAGHTNFFRGEITRYPGNWFYPFALLFRTTPLTLLGAILSTPLLFRRKQRTSLMALLGFAILFATFMSLGTKKFDRYLLPIFPALNIVAAGGFSYATHVVADSLLRWRLRGGVKKQWLFAVSILVVLLIQGILALPHHPYYLTYYNPLTGGLSQAPKTMLVGWGEGLDLAAEYLNRKKDAEKLNVATWNLVEFAPLFVGRAYSMKHYGKEYDPNDIDYFVFYLNQVQRNLSSSVLKIYHNRRKPEYVISLHGIDYAWIYPNARYVELLEYVESRAQPSDVILLSTPSLFAENYRGSLPHYVLCGDCSEAEIAQELMRLSTGHDRVWYISHPDLSGDSDRLIRYQLATHATKLEERSLPHVTVYCYLLPDPPSFRAFDIQPSAVHFEGKLMLKGYDFAERTGHWGKDLGIVLEWQASREVEQDYKAFLHLMDEEGRLWGQGDKVILNDALLPTSLWRARERVLDKYSLRLLAGIPPGRYWVEVGVYQTGTGHRLNILDENQAPVGTAYTLKEVEVVRSPLTPSLDDLEIQHQLSLELVEGLKLLGCNLGAKEVRSGEMMPVTLFWQSLKGIGEDYGLLLQLKDDSGEIWAEGRFPLASEFYPPSQWAAGEVLRGQHYLGVDAKAPTMKGEIMINVLDREGKPLLEESVSLAEVSILSRLRLFKEPEMEHPMQASLGDEVRFLGYDLSSEEVKPGQVLELTLYWQAQREMRDSYTVFTHLLDEGGRIWGQRDGIPVGGTSPTTGWVEGEVIVDRHEIVVDPAAPLGECILEIGMYDAATMRRLPVFDQEGARMPNDRILLSRVWVEQ